MPLSMPADPRLQQATPQVTPLDPGDPVAQTLAAMQQQGALPADSPAQAHLPAEAHVQGLIQNLMSNSIASQDSSIGSRALAAIVDMLDAGKHGVQSMMGTDQAEMDQAFETLAAKMPAPRTSDILMGPQGMSRYVLEMLTRGETDRRWSPETVKIAGNIATDPSTLFGVGLFRGLATGAAKAGAPRMVQATLKAAQAGDELSVQGMGALADGIIKLVQTGLVPANKTLSTLLPELPKWTEYAKKTAAMNDALQWLEHRQLDLNTLQSGFQQGSLTMQDVMEQLPRAMQSTVDPAHLELAITRMPPTTTAGAVAKWATSVKNPTADRGVAYENYKRWLLQDMGLANPAGARNFYNKFTDWWKQQALASISYLEQNAKGGLLGAMLTTGPGGAARTAADLFDNAGNILRGAPFNTKDALDLSKRANVPIPASLHEQADRALNAQVGPSSVVNLLGTRAKDVIGGAALGAGSAEMTDQNPVVGALLGGVTMGALPQIGQRLRRSSQGIETVLRERGWVEGMTKELADDVLRMNDEIARILTSPGATGSSARTTTTTLPGTPAQVIGTAAPAAASARGGMANVAQNLYHATDAQSALALVQNNGPDALRNLRVANVPVTTTSTTAPVTIQFGRLDQLQGQAMRGTKSAFRINSSAVPAAEVVEKVTFSKAAATDTNVLNGFRGLGWNENKLRGGVVEFENPNIIPWQSNVRQVPGTPPTTVTSTVGTPNAPVSQQFVDRLASMIAGREGQVDPNIVRQVLLQSTRVTPQKVEEATRVLDDALYQASRGGVAKSNEFNFDYQNLSPFERAVTSVAPFATWYLKAVPFFTKQGLQHPVLGSLLAEETRASADTREKRGLPGRFTGTIPNQAQGALLSALVGRPRDAFNNPLAALLPFAGLERSLNNAQYDEDMDPTMKVIKIALDQLGVNPLVASGLRVGGFGLYDMNDPSNPNFLRWGAPLAGATALASRGVEAMTGQNLGWNVDINAGLRKGEELLRETGDAATHRGQGRQVQDTQELAIERRVDELALKATGQPIGSNEPAVAPYVRARREKSGPIWDQARNEIAQERGVQSIAGFVAPDLRPDAILSPEEGAVRGARGKALIDAELSRTLDTAAEKDPKGRPDDKTVAAFRTALDSIKQTTGEPIPQIALDAIASPTNESLNWLSKEIYHWQVENDPLMQGYGAGGSMEERRIANDTSAMAQAGVGLDPALMQTLVGQNRAQAMAQGNLRGSGPIAATKKVATQERDLIKKQDPLMEEYLTWKITHPGLEVADFLKEKYRR